jgi:hypothetical protein
MRVSTHLATIRTLVTESERVCSSKSRQELCAHASISQAYEHLSQRVNVCVQAKEEKSKGAHAPFLHALKHFRVCPIRVWFLPTRENLDGGDTVRPDIRCLAEPLVQKCFWRAPSQRQFRLGVASATERRRNKSERVFAWHTACRAVFVFHTESE